MSFQYIIRRALYSILLLLGVTIVTFALLHITPGDPAIIMLGEQATPEAQADLRRALGLDRPLHEQYFRYLSRAVQGDFGDSIRAQRPVLSYTLERFPATIQLTVIALIIALLVAVPIGVMSAVWRGSLFDNIASFFALLGQSMPAFWLGLMMISFFSVRLGWLPTSGRGSVEQMIMPSVTLAAFLVGLIVRLTRSSMLEVLRQDFVRTARSKGLREYRVIFQHALRTAWIPIVTVLGLQIGTLLGGAVITETVFSWPGIGTLLLASIAQRDYPVVQMIVLLMATTFVLINFAVDVLYVWLDPRISH